MKSIADFKNHYNQLVNDWFNNTFNTNPFMVASKVGWIDKNCVQLMPEPYYGKIDNNSVTVLNLHPAYRKSELSVLDSASMSKRIINTYDNYADSFPPLQSNHFYLRSHQWWQNLLSKPQFSIIQECNPFAIETCPWHSKGWGYHENKTLLKDNLLDKEIFDYVIMPYIVGIIYSKFKIGIAFSNLAVNILKKLLHINSKQIKEWNNCNCQQLWPSVNSTQDKVKFYYLKLPISQIITKESEIFSDNTLKKKITKIKYIKILGMSTPMGKQPDPAFWENNGVIDQIIKHIRIH